MRAFLVVFYSGRPKPPVSTQERYVFMFTTGRQRLFSFIHLLWHECSTFFAPDASPRVWWKHSELASVELLLTTTLLLGLLTCSAGFFFGLPCSPTYLWGSFIFVTFLAGYHSWQRLATFIFCTLCLLFLTAYTFSYTGTDAGAYHVPMQRLLAGGWNPIFTSSIEEFQTYVANMGKLSPYHTLFLPKTTALCGALISLSTRLWCADAFLGYTLILLLFATAQRFAFHHWTNNTFACIIFALALTSSTKVTSFLAGQVDYTAYAALLSATLALPLWLKSKSPRDLVTFGIGLVFCMTSKSTGFICGIILLLAGLILTYRNSQYWWLCVTTLLVVIVIGASPLLTAWIQYGSPFYPSMTFDPNIAPIDITNDFIGNPDGERMGYIARIVYAWFSQTLAIKGCAWFYNSPTFSPEFYVAGGVGGLGTIFRLSFCLSIVALLLSKKNAVFWIALFILVSSNLAPLKYLGYNRYFPQMWALPFLAFFNVLYAPTYALPLKWQKTMRLAAAVALIVFISPILLRTLAYQTRQIILEAERQITLSTIHERTVQLSPNDDTFTVRQRLLANGIQVTSNLSAPLLNMNRKDLLFGENANSRAAELRQQVPICDTLQQLLTFPWLKVTSKFPYPIFYNTP